MSIKAAWRNGILTFYDANTHERVLPLAPLVFVDDFLSTDLMVAASDVRGWTKKDTGVGNVPAAILANQHGGVVQMGLDATNEKQEAGLYMGDALNWNLDKGPIIEIGAAIHTTPTGQAEIYFGLANAYVEGPIAEADAGPTVHAFFCFDGALACKIFTDDTSNDNDAVATGVTVVEDALHIFRIDATNPADVKFFIDGVQVAPATTFDMSTGANVVLQPFIMVHKETGTGLGVLYVDFVRIWSPR
jgi:hypothetical protein